MLEVVDVGKNAMHNQKGKWGDLWRKQIIGALDVLPNSCEIFGRVICLMHDKERYRDYNFLDKTHSK